MKITVIVVAIVLTLATTLLISYIFVRYTILKRNDSQAALFIEGEKGQHLFAIGEIRTCKKTGEIDRRIIIRATTGDYTQTVVDTTYAYYLRRMTEDLRAVSETALGIKNHNPYGDLIVMPFTERIKLACWINAAKDDKVALYIDNVVFMRVVDLEQLRYAPMILKTLDPFFEHKDQWIINKILEEIKANFGLDKKYR